MPDIGELLPVLGYSSGWMWLGIALLLVVVGWYVSLMLFTRVRDQPVEPAAQPVLSYADRVFHLKAEYLAKVDTVVTRARNGELSPRRAHSELSLLVRDFATKATGIQANYMTLTDLKQTGLTSVTAAVQDFYPAAFAEAEADSVAAGVQQAQEVIGRWS